MVIKSLMVGLFILVSTINLDAKSYFSGEITRDTRWMGDIYIDGDVVVRGGVILSIDSGSRIIFKPHTDAQKSGKDHERAEIIVYGILLAKGTSSQNPVVFTSESQNPQMNDWYGIEIKNLYDKSLLTHCIVEYGYKGVTCYGSAPVISNSEIRFNYHSGVSCEVRATPRITNCLILGNGFAGVNAELGASPVIGKCTLTQNNYGIVIFDRSNPDLGRFPATQNGSNGENLLFNNFEFDVYNHSSNTIYAQNNLWNTSNYDDIDLAIYDHTKNASYGAVIIKPIFLKKKRQWVPIRTGPVHDNGFQPLATKTPDTSAVHQPPGPDNLFTQETDSGEKQPFTVAQPETVTKVMPETVYVYKYLPQETTAAVKKKNVGPQEPVLESFLDSGRRQYLNRAKPVYPDIYRRTGFEGDVFVEIEVGLDGRVAGYHILRSDGELFTQAVVKALEKFRYKPGTVDGRPVRFKIVERFRFRRNSS